MQSQQFQQVPMQQAQRPSFVTTTQQPATGTVVNQTIVSSGTGRRSGMKSAIPDLPFVLALIYGILNFFFPGLGTILAGISVLCCGNLEQTSSDRVNAFCINIFVGVLQAGLAFVFIGWVWSVIWGIAIITNSGTSVQEIQPPISTVTIATNQQTLPQPTFQQAPVYQQTPGSTYPQPIGFSQPPPVKAWN